MLSFFRRRWYYPIAFIFGENADVQIFDFHDAYIKMIKSGDEAYKKMEEEFFKKVNLL